MKAEEEKEELKATEEISEQETACADAEASDSVNSEVERLTCELEKKNQEIASLKDMMLRRQADFENYKKMGIKREEQNKKMAVVSIASHILRINDDLIRAAEAAGSISEDSSAEEVRNSFVEGVTIISKGINAVLENYSITEIESENTPFDPNLHEAVEIDMQEGISCDTVTKVYQKGYRLDDFVIRTAKVKVSKPAPAQQ